MVIFIIGLVIGTFVGLKSHAFVLDIILDYQQIKDITQENDIKTPFSYIPNYYVNDNDLLTLSFDKNVKSIEDFPHWKKNLLAFDDKEKYLNIDLLPLQKTNLINEIETKNYVRKKYVMESTDSDQIIFYELIPKFKQKTYSTILLVSGTGHQGARDLLGISSDISKYYYQNELAVKLVDFGYVVFVPELRGYGERAINFDYCDRVLERERLIQCSGKVFGNYLDLMGIDLILLQQQDVSLVLKYISNLDYVDKNNIAIGGLSLGAGIASTISTYNPNIIKATISASGTGSVARAPPTLEAAGHGKLLYFDSNDFVATIAPRPLYVSFGENEHGIFGWEARTNYSGNFFKKVYNLLDKEENFYYIVHNGVHEYDVPSIIDFLNKHFNN